MNHRPPRHGWGSPLTVAPCRWPGAHDLSALPPATRFARWAGDLNRVRLRRLRQARCARGRRATSPSSTSWDRSYGRWRDRQPRRRTVHAVRAPVQVRCSDRYPGHPWQCDRLCRCPGQHRQPTHLAPALRDQGRQRSTWVTAVLVPWCAAGASVGIDPRSVLQQRYPKAEKAAFNMDGDTPAVARRHLPRHQPDGQAQAQHADQEVRRPVSHPGWDGDGLQPRSRYCLRSQRARGLDSAAWPPGSARSRPPGSWATCSRSPGSTRSSSRAADTR